jgi:dihydrofolate reductase
MSLHVVGHMPKYVSLDRLMGLPQQEVGRRDVIIDSVGEHPTRPRTSRGSPCPWTGRRAVMGKVTSEISMSLDGFITGPNVGVGNGMGDDGDRLHDWRFDAKTETDTAIVDEIYESTGAVVIGKRMFDVGFEPWGDPPPFGMPVFVVTHEEREPLPMQGGTTYTFVTDGIEAALELARAAAGDKNVGIWGGANTIREYLRAGLLDEMQIHLVPMLLGDGIRLFEDLGPERIELRRTSSIETPGATHFRFEVLK